MSSGKRRYISLYRVSGAFMFGAVACVDAPAASRIIAPSSVSSATVGASSTMRAHRFDAPALRPWDRDTTELRKALDAADGWAVVSFKQARTPRSLENGGQRGELSSDDFRLAANTLIRIGASIDKEYADMGMARVRIPSAVAAALLRNDLIDFIDPDMRQLLKDGHDPVSAARPTAAPGVSALSTALAAPYGDPELDANYGIGMLQIPGAWANSTGTSGKIMLMSAWGVMLGHNDHPALTTANCGGVFGACNGAKSYLTNLAVGAWTARRNNYLAVGVAPGIPPANIYSWRVALDNGTYYFSTIIDGIQMAISQGVKTLLFYNLGSSGNRVCAGINRRGVVNERVAQEKSSILS